MESLSPGSGQGIRAITSEPVQACRRVRTTVFSGWLGLRGDLLVGDFEVTGSTGLLRVMRLAVAEAALLRGGLLLHASAVLVEGRVWVFLGASGTGKTTLAEELRGAGETFSVDCSLVYVDKGREPVAYPTPFSDWNGTVVPREEHPVAGIVFIEQAPEPWVKRISTLEATRRLMHQIIMVPGQPDSTARALESGEALCGQVGCYHMGFRRDESFWPLLFETAREERR